MREYRVAQDGSAPFASIGEALHAIHSDDPAILRVGAGVYREKLFCEHKRIALIGAGREQTRIVWGDAGYDELPDGKRGTFRSYTAFFDGDMLFLSDLTVQNDAGEGEQRGQAVAAALHSRQVWCKNVAFVGRQDTLFCAPLPMKEHEPRGFLGPREFAPREKTAQVFESCTIFGTVDFIFGGASAVFEGCEVVCLKRPQGMAGYVTAPSTPEGELGMVFVNCAVHGADGCADGSYALGRPWREHAAAAFVRCELGECVSKQGFAPWSGTELPNETRFAVSECTGVGSCFAQEGRFYGKRLSGAQGEALVEKAEGLKAAVQAERQRCFGL